MYTEAGGQIRSAYGWVIVDSPNGLTHQVCVRGEKDGRQKSLPIPIRTA